MADNLTDRGAQDRARINLGEEHEILYWTEALNVSEAQLRMAVGAVGVGAEAVRKFLNRD
jgi:hypothetical protein